MTLPFALDFSRLVVPKQAPDWIPVGLGLVVKINLNFHVRLHCCVCIVLLQCSVGESKHNLLVYFCIEYTDKI